MKQKNLYSSSNRIVRFDNAQMTRLIAKLWPEKVREELAEITKL